MGAGDQQQQQQHRLVWLADGDKKVGEALREKRNVFMAVD
jgi:hypothetical protein